MLPSKMLITAANRGIDLTNLQALVTRSPSDQCRLATRDTMNGDSPIQELRKWGVQAEADVEIAGAASIKATGREVRKQYE